MTRLIQMPATVSNTDLYKLPFPADIISHDISVDIKPVSSHLLRILITIPNSSSMTIYEQTLRLFGARNLEGFAANNAPAEYLEITFKSEIENKVKNYLLKHVVLDLLFNELARQKILISNHPRLDKSEVREDKSVSFSFTIATTDKIEFKEWKHFSFKTPKRKRYKDLDKQVGLFLERESAAAKKAATDLVEDGDWVGFCSTLLDKDKMPLPLNFSSFFWMRIKAGEIGEPLSAHFFGKKLNESFTSNDLNGGDFGDGLDDLKYNFLISITAIIKGKYLSVECFKNTFKLKNKSEIHNKLMEVFSYRNDQSQRRSIIEEIFHLLLSKHRFEIPKHLVLRRQQELLHELSQQTDYRVYKAQKDFVEQIELLAEKQIKEEALIDQIAYNENMKIDLKDIQNYLHLFNSKRLREFIYFKPLDDFYYDNLPLGASMLAQVVMREKTLNHVIHLLSS